ncbi:hypothetical protein [Ruminococcus flavefaciens]|uniref:hypothetical protein n=1 Tax=Ruminococcus flavefaciens TaxID=1265 RepID=UPI0026EC4926|nr:hypothetical protein [Ruminococcus flavefaciens]MDD7517205.1 hypothetical protein [Ruminococcus flavefaciens]MDY5690121.1 hypothetical protein [Ruminococcus flavefaciens]
MIALIKQTSDFIRQNVKSPDALCCAEAVYGIVNHTMATDTALSAISALLKKNVAITEDIPNVATAFVVASVKLLRNVLVAQNYMLAYDTADMLHELPTKPHYSNSGDIFDYNCNYIRSFNKKYPCRIPEIVY